MSRVTRCKQPRAKTAVQPLELLDWSDYLLPPDDDELFLPILSIDCELEDAFLTGSSSDVESSTTSVESPVAKAKPTTKRTRKRTYELRKVYND